MTTPDSTPQTASSTKSGAIPTKTRLLRVTILCHRNPSMSESEFHTYWSTTHAQKVSAHLAKFGILSYKQYHSTAALRNDLGGVLSALGLGIDVSEMMVEYDGFVELLMPDLSCYEQAIKDEYYREVVAPDERVFADWGRSRLTIGWEEVYVMDGKVVDSPV